MIQLQPRYLRNTTLSSCKISVRRVYGDGNCLYRAVSSALFGSESHHLLLRLLTTIEIACHRHIYDITDHQCILNDNRVVSSTYHDLLMSAVKPSRRNATHIPARPATHYAKAHRSVKAKRYAYPRPTRHTYAKARRSVKAKRYAYPRPTRHTYAKARRSVKAKRYAYLRPTRHTYTKAHRSVKAKRYAYLRPTRHTYAKAHRSVKAKRYAYIPARPATHMLKPAAPSRRNAMHISARPATHMLNPARPSIGLVTTTVHFLYFLY